MISRRAALRVLAIAPAAAAMSVAGQAAPSEAPAPAELDQCFHIMRPTMIIDFVPQADGSLIAKHRVVSDFVRPR